MLIAPLTEEILSSSSAISTGAGVPSVSLDVTDFVKKPSETIAINLGIGVVSNSGNPLGFAAIFPPSSHASSSSCVPLTAILLGKEIKIKKHVCFWQVELLFFFFCFIEHSCPLCPLA